jgi:hypothetical protein
VIDIFTSYNHEDKAHVNGQPVGGEEDGAGRRVVVYDRALGACLSNMNTLLEVALPEGATG